MKVKNIMQIALLTGLVTSSSTQCMLVLQKVSTLLGVGLPTTPFLIGATASAYQAYKNPVSAHANLHPLCPEHEAFYREVVGNKIQLMGTSHTNNAFNHGNLIVMPDTITMENGTISLGEALKSKNYRAQEAFKGISEHEYSHYKNNDGYTMLTEIVTLPIVTTAVAAVAFKKTFPASTTKHVARCSTKIIAGTAGFYGNKEMVERNRAYWLRNKKEFAADQGISEKNIPAVLEFLDTNDNIIFTRQAKKNYPNLTEQEQKNKAFQLQSEYYSKPYATHPSPQSRRKALLDKRSNL